MSLCHLSIHLILILIQVKIIAVFINTELINTQDAHVQFEATQSGVLRPVGTLTKQEQWEQIQK